MEGHSQLANCVRGKTMALFKPWRYLVSKPPNLDVPKEARILCDEVQELEGQLLAEQSNSEINQTYGLK